MSGYHCLLTTLKNVSKEDEEEEEEDDGVPDETEMNLEYGDSDTSDEEQMAAESADVQRSVCGLTCRPQGKRCPRAPGASEESPEEFQFSSLQSLSCVQLFVAPWTAARQASLSITNSRS